MSDYPSHDGELSIGFLRLSTYLRKRLTADVAHELRIPLATLQTHMEAMVDGIWESTTARLESCLKIACL